MNKLTKTHLRRLRIRRGLDSQRNEVLFEEGEPVYTKDKKSVFVGNNKTYGGVLASTKNHIRHDDKIPEIANKFDIVINGDDDGGGYIVDTDGSLRKIFTSNSDINDIKKRMYELDHLLDRLNIECCNPDFRLITDSGQDILTDDSDWISIRSNPVCYNPVIIKPKTVTPLTWTDPIMYSDVTYNITLGANTHTIIPVSAIGSGTITYQWYKSNNGTFDIMNGYNSNSLIFVNINISNLTAYKCIASSDLTPSIESGIRTLKLNPTTTPPTTPTPVATPLTWVTQPTSTSSLLNGTVSFSVLAVGSGIITYQWYKSLSPYNIITGATNKTLTISNVTNNDIAKYICVASSTTTSDISSNEVQLTLTSPPVTVPAITKPTADTTDSSSYTDYILYTPKNFKIYTMIKKSCNFPSNVLQDIKDAVNKWSSVLKNTILPDQDQPTTLSNFDGTVSPNPLKFKNDGYVLVVDSEHMLVKDPKTGLPVDNSSTLAYAKPSYYRQDATDFNTDHFILPSAGIAVINTVTMDAMSKSIFGIDKKSNLYKIMLHELGHALGIGVMWFLKQSASSLFRSFVVGAGDNSANPTNGLLGNIFYTTNRGTGQRLRTDVMDSSSLSNETLSTWGDAKYRYAYNPNTTIGNSSSAVGEYNKCFNLSLTAIPLESGLGGGSYGGHWAEGQDTFAGDPNEGSDIRQYYGNAFPGAPALQDELMTPIADTIREMPLSKISLGALSDLGWVVDYNQADNYEPLVHVIQYDSTGNSLEMKLNNFGIFIPNQTDPTSTIFTVFQHLRRGLTYKFINNTSEDLEILNQNTNLVLTQGVTNNNIAGVKYMQYVVPSSLTLSPNQVIIIQTKSASTTKPKAIIFMNVV
jgi:hypothetical protein